MSEKIKASFDQLGRDLYWKIYAEEDGFIRWKGYDDNNWWGKVSTTDAFQRKVGKETGRIFELDPTMSEVRVFTAPGRAEQKEQG